jgi:HD-GYP domain-containing protein (c-di-GMP phosphodiesterase class II)
LGKQILSRHDGFDSICEIIVQHHEKIDGSGFPHHLIGKEINPGAAIIGVVDSYHTLFFKRKKERSTINNTSVSVASTATIMDNTKARFAMAMNYLNQKAGKIFDTKVVEVFTNLIDKERRLQGEKMVMRLPLGKIEPGMIIAEDYFSSYGMLIAASGEVINEEMKKSLIRFAESGEIPLKLLVLR